ncbi:hypothetical protein JXL19_03470 [bacterium]|nr:hypothetical protein [bacterium]
MKHTASEAKRRYFAIALIGANSICSQIILIREIIAVFSGNELTLGFVLASWFVWVAAGSAIGGRIWDDKDEDALRKRFAVFQTIIPFILILQIIIIRQSRYIFGFPPMATLGLGQIFMVSFLLLWPLCIILGLMFSLGYQWLSISLASPAKSVGRVYVLEAIGAGAGGVLFSFLLVRIMSHFQISLILALPNLMSTLFILHPAYSRRNCAGVWISVILVFLFSITFLSSFFLPLDKIIYSLQWRGFDLLDCRDSIFGRIALTRMNGEYSFYEHGVLTGTIPDLWTSEWITHLPLVQHPEPRKALLIGTGIGSLAEALKHPSLDIIEYIELDPTALIMAEEHCPEEYIEPLTHERVHAIHGDARLYLRETGKIYDVIILGLPDPKTAQINRMYTMEFFKLAANHLSEKGITAFSLTSSENYIGPQLSDFLRCIYKTLAQVFPEILVTPGDTAYFIAGKSPGFMSLEPEIIVQRLNEKKIETAFFSEYYLPSLLNKERTEILKNMLGDTHGVFINKDMRPICYFYDLILWGRYFSPITGKALEKAKETDAKWPLLFLLLAAFLAASSRFLGKEKGMRITVGMIVLLGGFVEILLEFLLILSFQIFYGYAYIQLGILITGFMVGLTLGSALMTHMLDSLTGIYQWYIGIQVSYFIYPLLLIILFLRIDIGLLPAIAVEILFLTLTLIAGFIGGFQFPLATSLFISSDQKWKGQAGLLYGLDLIGAAAGAVLASSYLVPIFGIITCLGVLSLIGGIGLCLLLINQ